MPRLLSPVTPHSVLTVGNNPKTLQDVVSSIVGQVGLFFFIVNLFHGQYHYHRATNWLLAQEDFFTTGVLNNQAWKKYLFPYKLGKISLQQGRFPSSVEGFPLRISLFFSPPNHKISLQGASRFVCFFPGLVLMSVIWLIRRTSHQISILNTISTIENIFLTKNINFLLTNVISSYFQLSLF